MWSWIFMSIVVSVLWVIIGAFVKSEKKGCWKKKKKEEKTYMEKIEEAKKFMLGILKGFTPDVGLVLGSGLGPLADEIEDKIVIPFSKIPNFPVSTFEDDEKMVVVCGKLGGRNVITTKYRTHYYEGYTMKEITFPIRLMVALGIRNLVLSNAAGGAREDLNPGDLMLISDHINLSGDNPMIGPNVPMGDRFFDCSNLYDKDIRDLVKHKAKELGIDLKEGVYVMFAGPNYETPAEIRMIMSTGGHAAGMSTVPEALVASHCKVKVTAISMITNKAAGLVVGASLNHEEVKETASLNMDSFKKLMVEILPFCTNPKEEEKKE